MLLTVFLLSDIQLSVICDKILTHPRSQEELSIEVIQSKQTQASSYEWRLHIDPHMGQSPGTIFFSTKIYSYNYASQSQNQFKTLDQGDHRH